MGSENDGQLQHLTDEPLLRHRDDALIETADGEQSRLLAPQVPSPFSIFAPLQEHVVSDGERMDLITARKHGRCRGLLAHLRRERRDAS